MPDNPTIPRRDLEFLLYEWLDVAALTERERFSDHSRESFDAVLELSEEIATEKFAPHYKTTDSHEPHMLADGTVELIPEVGAALKSYAESGFFAGSFDEDLGGIQLPTSVARASMAIFTAANTSTSGYPFLTQANAAAIVAHGSPEQVDTWVRPMLEGRFFGTMCLSEPEAGSSLADITTRAEPQPDGTYRIFGRKMWISGGDHEISENIVHLVLAKIPGGPPGVKGISLFIVPKHTVDDAGAIDERNDVTLAGLNHKMGFRGTTNTALNFGDGQHQPGGAPGAVGYLVGEPHRGLFYMFHMMNEARIGVGLIATALGYTGYLQARDYAKERLQGRTAAAKDPSGPQAAIIDHADVRRMLLAQKSYAEGALALGLYCSDLVDRQDTAADDAERDGLRQLLEVLTPIAKSWPSQWCLAANDLAIQVHGGYGYTRDYNVEQLYRDNRLNMIHEGTHGIQGLDLLGRKVVMDDGAALTQLADRVRATLSRATATGDETLTGFAAEIDARLDRVLEVTKHVWEGTTADVALANASIYLEAFGHLILAWIWLEQSLAAHGKSGDFYDGKRAAAAYFRRYELPKIDTQLDLVASLDRLTIDLDPTWF
ncbi:acyl-CoA dehydrogenase [Microbacterium sp. A94]|uniref:acyl-CoA dehydrogenase n=1 Tax=Microbacterium sp. A94 TaxID=3450717 RepID=UPI003F44311B